MTAFLQFKPFHTSKVWRFIDPDTGYKHAAADKQSLIKDIVSYRANNQLPPIEHLPAVLENYLCGLPENCGSCEAKSLKRGWLTSIKGGISLLEWATFPEEHTVTQAEAEERAEQCTACPKNVSIDAEDLSDFQKWSDHVAAAFVGDKRTSKHNYLGSCSVCTCVLKAVVWYKGDPKLTPQQKQEAESVNCWKLKWYQANGKSN